MSNFTEIKIPSFGEKNYIDDRENRNTRLFSIFDCTKDLFYKYCELFCKASYEKKEEYRQNEHLFAAFKRGEEGIFINYYGSVRELRIVKEAVSTYFSYIDTFQNTLVEPQITQIDLVDFGMSYVIRLSDGRFIIIDGGQDFDEDSDKIYTVLKEGSPHEKPIIASWIMTHPHEDHYHCHFGFMNKYKTDVIIEKYMFTFPEADDGKHFPNYDCTSPIWGDVSWTTNIPKFLNIVEKTGAAVYHPHTGQKFVIGDAKCEILSSMDDTLYVTKNENATSLIIRMELGGQTIIWAADGCFSYAKLAERYGEYLKADILQIPHHGFGGGRVEGEIAGYKLIDPKVCFLPVSDYCAYTFFSVFKGGARYLMHHADVEEIISGDGQRTITLPYSPEPYRKRELEERYYRGLDDNGARTWIFTGLSSSDQEDLVFSFLNMTAATAKISAELFFEDPALAIRDIKIEIGGVSTKTLSIVGKETNRKLIYLSGKPMAQTPIPENATFSLRFLSDVPIVVSHKKHKETYRSSINYIL